MKPAKCLVMNEWKCNTCTCTVEYYSALKRKEALTSATTQKNLDHMMLREINSHKEIKSMLFPLHLMYSGIVTLIEIKQNGSGQGLAERSCGVRVSVLQGKK